MAGTFEKASQRAELWLNAVEMIAEFGERGDVDSAYRDLAHLAGEYNRHFPALNAEMHRLRALSDGPVMWEHGRGWSAISRVPKAAYPHRWSSAHEAAVGIVRIALDSLLVPVTGRRNGKKDAAKILAARWKAISISLDEVADLQERIRRERAKLSEARSEPHTPTKPKQPKSTVNRESQALAVFIEHPTWTKKQIAAHIGCNEKQLAPKRMPKLAAAIAAHRAPVDPSRKTRRGTKDSEGNLEAWERIDGSE